jgi:hypothetical protein
MRCNKYGNESAAEKQREDGLNIDEVAAATNQFEQDSFHGFSFALLTLSHGGPENLRNESGTRQGFPLRLAMLRKPGRMQACCWNTLPAAKRLRSYSENLSRDF